MPRTINLVFGREGEEVPLVIECGVTPGLDEEGAVIIPSASIGGEETPCYGESEECGPAFNGIDGMAAIAFGKFGNPLCVRYEGGREQLGEYHNVGVALHLAQRVGGRDYVGFRVGKGYVERYGADFHAFSGLMPLNGA